MANAYCGFDAVESLVPGPQGATLEQKEAMAERMHTSRWHLDGILDAGRSPAEPKRLAISKRKRERRRGRDARAP